MPSKRQGIISRAYVVRLLQNPARVAVFVIVVFEDHNNHETNHVLAIILMSSAHVHNSPLKYGGMDPNILHSSQNK